jgi:hypothetical protein
MNEERESEGYDVLVLQFYRFPFFSISDQFIISNDNGKRWQKTNEDEETA